MPCPSPGDLPDPGMEPRSLALPAHSLPPEPRGKPKLIYAAAAAKLLQLCPAVCDTMKCSSSRLLCPCDSPGKNTGVGCHALLQGIFLIQRWNLCLLRCRSILYDLSHDKRCQFSLLSCIFYWVPFPTAREHHVQMRLLKAPVSAALQKLTLLGQGCWRKIDQEQPST